MANIVFETCPHCDKEQGVDWDVHTEGYSIFCPNCGEKIYLCSECGHTDDCDWNSETKTCKMENAKKYPKLFTPDRYKVYQNENGYDYFCVNANDSFAEFVSRSGWHFKARSCRKYESGKIEWDSSYDGEFISKAQAQEYFDTYGN